MDRSTEVFEQYRPRLFQLAYGMLGRVASAEDAVQEAFLRWQKLDVEKIRSEQSYLSTIVSRICLDEIKSARNRREQYVGPDLPEPLLESNNEPPERQVELADSLSMALLVVLQQLTPLQRAVFLLREAFDYDYASIADITGKSESYCRKIAQRARERVEENRPRFEPSKEEQHRLVESFMEAALNGDVAALESMLADDATLYSDGGGKVAAARKPVAGGSTIAKFLIGIQKGISKVHVELRDVNGEPGGVAYVDEQLQSVLSFLIEDGKIQNIYVVVNPEKLEHLRRES